MQNAAGAIPLSGIKSQSTCKSDAKERTAVSKISNLEQKSIDGTLGKNPSIIKSFLVNTNNEEADGNAEEEDSSSDWEIARAVRKKRKYYYGSTKNDRNTTGNGIDKSVLPGK